MEQPLDQWDAWNHVHMYLADRDRVPFMHQVLFEPSAPQLGQDGILLHSRLGLSLNVSSTGLCLLVDQAPVVGEIWRVRMPGSTVGVQTPTLADVRWVRSVPFERSRLSVVGLKFVL